MDRVVVVGAGVVGCAIARALAPDHAVRVVERAEVGAGTTADSAGKVTMTPAYSDVPVVAAHANDFFETREEYVPRESLELVPPAREGEARRRVDRLAGEGLDVQFLDSDATEARYPRIDCGSHCGAVRHERTGFVDATALTDSLASEAASRGATFLTDTAVREIRVESGAVDGVATADGILSCEAVVVAAGWRTPDLLAGHLTIPVRPYRTQCAVYRPADPLPEGFPQGGVPDERVYFRPVGNSDYLLVGGWAQPLDDPGSANHESDAAFRSHVRSVVPSFLDAGEGTIGDHWAGVDCGTPDARPIVDAPAVGPDGLVVATGFHGRGVMTAPVAATAVRSLLAGERAPFPTDVFALDRFTDRSRDFDFFSIGRNTE